MELNTNYCVIPIIITLETSTVLLYSIWTDICCLCCYGTTEQSVDTSRKQRSLFNRRARVQSSTPLLNFTGDEGTNEYYRDIVLCVHCRNLHKLSHSLCYKGMVMCIRFLHFNGFEILRSKQNAWICKHGSAYGPRFPSVNH